MGGTVVDSIPYDTTTTDFSPTLATLNTDWATGVSDAGGNNNSVAIQMVAFDEGALYFNRRAQAIPTF